eukprot:m.69484 g.69484  ORF g.69484 m.69484 type:complete len:567 (+) comp14253_c0_seq1:317-2017(+)
MKGFGKPPTLSLHHLQHVLQEPLVHEVDKLVLLLGLDDEAAALRAHVRHNLLHRDRLVGVHLLCRRPLRRVHQQAAQSQRHTEGTRPPHTRAAVADDRLVRGAGHLEDILHHAEEGLGRLGCAKVGPGREMELHHLACPARRHMLQLEEADDIAALVAVARVGDSQIAVLLLLALHGRPVAEALLHAALHLLRQHDNDVHLLLEDHGPEVVGRVRQRALRHNHRPRAAAAARHRQEVRVDVVSVRMVPQHHPRALFGQHVVVPVQRLVQHGGRVVVRELHLLQLLELRLCHAVAARRDDRLQHGLQLCVHRRRRRQPLQLREAAQLQPVQPRLCVLRHPPCTTSSAAAALVAVVVRRRDNVLAVVHRRRQAAAVQVKARKGRVRRLTPRQQRRRRRHRHQQIQVGLRRVFRVVVAVVAQAAAVALLQHVPRRRHAQHRQRHLANRLAQRVLRLRQRQPAQAPAVHRQNAVVPLQQPLRAPVRRHILDKEAHLAISHCNSLHRVAQRPAAARHHQLHLHRPGHHAVEILPVVLPVRLALRCTPVPAVAVAAAVGLSVGAGRQRRRGR